MLQGLQPGMQGKQAQNKVAGTLVPTGQWCYKYLFGSRSQGPQSAPTASENTMFPSASKIKLTVYTHCT